MMLSKLLSSRYLSVLIFLVFASAEAQTGCKEIKTGIEVLKNEGHLKIDLKGQSTSQLLISLIGPKGYLKKDITENEITGLSKGGYTLVINGRKEEDNFCIKSFQFTID